MFAGDVCLSEAVDRGGESAAASRVEREKKRKKRKSPPLFLNFGVGDWCSARQTGYRGRGSRRPAAPMWVCASLFPFPTSSVESIAASTLWLQAGQHHSSSSSSSGSNSLRSLRPSLSPSHLPLPGYRLCDTDSAPSFPERSSARSCLSFLARVVERERPEQSIGIDTAPHTLPPQRRFPPLRSKPDESSQHAHDKRTNPHDHPHI